MNDYKSKSDTLLYHGNLSSETVAKMKECRAKFIELSRYVEALGSSREVSLAFTGIEHAQMLAIKHLCMVDPQAVLESVA
jgi:hypothetical protein